MLPVLIYETDDGARMEILSLLNGFAQAHGRRFSVLGNTDSLEEADFCLKSESGILLLILGVNGAADPGFRSVQLESLANRTNRDSYALYWLHNLEDLPGLTARCLHPVGFVLPPPDKAHVEAIFQRVFDDYDSLSDGAEERFISLQSGGAIYRLAMDSIDYIEALYKKLNIWTKRQCLTVYAKLGQMEQLLGESFFRCHRSYLINFTHLESADFAAMEICLQSGVRLPLSRSYRDGLKSRMLKEGAADET